MTKCHFSNFCRKKVPGMTKKCLKSQKKSHTQSYPHTTYYPPHSQFEKPSFAENLTFIYLSWISSFQTFQKILCTFYNSHQSTWVPKIYMYLVTLESTKYLNLRLSVQEAQLIILIFNDFQFCFYKEENILKGSMNLIPSPSMKI